MSKLLTAVGFCRASRSLCNEQTRRASISRGLTLCAVTAVACFPSVGGMLFGVVGASVGATVMLMAMAVLTYKFKALAKMVSFVARGIDAIFQIILGDRPDRRAVALAREIGALLVAAIAICLLPLMGSLLLGKFGGIAATSGMLILLQALEASNLYQDSRELLFAGRITRPPHRIIKLLGWVKRRRD